MSMAINAAANQHKEKLITKTVKSCITYDHSGKMENIFSVNGDLNNNFCDNMRKNEKSICNSCYVVKLPWYKSLLGKYTKAIIFQKKIIPVADMPIITGYDIGRFNAFSELHNVTEAINFLHFAIANNHINMALWTKRIDLVYKAFLKTGYNKPENLNIIYSDPIINGSGNATNILEKYYINGKRLIDRVFIVVSLDYAVKHNLTINCHRHCYTCGDSCYLECKDPIVYELLKCNQKKAIQEGLYD